MVPGHSSGCRSPYFAKYKYIDPLLPRKPSPRLAAGQQHKSRRNRKIWGGGACLRRPGPHVLPAPQPSAGASGGKRLPGAEGPPEGKDRDGPNVERSDLFISLKCRAEAPFSALRMPRLPAVHTRLRSVAYACSGCRRDGGRQAAAPDAAWLDLTKVGGCSTTGVRCERVKGWIGGPRRMRRPVKPRSLHGGDGLRSAWACGTRAASRAKRNRVALNCTTCTPPRASRPHICT